MSDDPTTLRSTAAKLRAQAREIAASGGAPAALRAVLDAAEQLERAAAALERAQLGLEDTREPTPEERAAVLEEMHKPLQHNERSSNVQEMTAASMRRGEAIAAARLEQDNPGDTRRAAIVAKWGSQSRAAKALRISAGSLTLYLDEKVAIPRRVANRLVEAGIPLDSWKSIAK